MTEGSLLAGSGVGILMRPVSLHFLARGPRRPALATPRCGIFTTTAASIMMVGCMGGL